MALPTMYEILIPIIGTPTNDMQWLILYFSASQLSVMMFYFVLYIFKLTAGIIGNSKNA